MQAILAVVHVDAVVVQLSRGTTRVRDTAGIVAADLKPRVKTKRPKNSKNFENASYGNVKEQPISYKIVLE